MQADLEFEYPQKLEKLLVRSDLLRWLDEEEEKLKRSVNESYQIMEQQSILPGQANAQSGAKQAILTYEDYYGIDYGVGGGAAGNRNLSDKGKISFEQFVQQTATENIFDNDLLEQQYKFWESVEDREIRLKQLWIDLKRKNALGGIDAVSNEEQTKLNTDITDLVRRIRWRTDQELTRRNIEPVFKDNYAGKYDKEEFLIDAGMEFFKIKKLLSKNPKLLKDDPILSLDYFKIINLIKRKKLLEETSDHYNAEDSVNTVWNDITLLERT